MSNQEKKNLGAKVLILSDVIAFVFVIFPVGAAWALSLVLAKSAMAVMPWFIPVMLFPLVLSLAFILVCWILRSMLPTLKPGVYDKDSKMMKIWFCHFLLGNALQAAGLQPAIYSSHFLKHLYWKAMGAKIGYGILCNHLTRIRDFPLLEIGSGTSLSADTHIASHTWVGDRLLLGQVKIGKNVFLGMNVTVGPRTVIDDNAWVGFGNNLFRATIKAGERVENFAMAHGRAEKSGESE